MSTERKLFKVEAVTFGGTEWVPVWAYSLDQARDLAEAEYGEENVGRVRPEVNHG